METERKFLVRKRGAPYRGLAFASHRISQGYIHSGRNATVRVRTSDGRGFLTIKGPSGPGGLSRYEFEKEIPLEEALELMRLCEAAPIEKTRYLVRSGAHVFEVDEFHGANEGLVLAEVELSREDEPFVRPGFIGDEVTGDARFYNSSLSVVPYPSWRDGLPAESR